MKRLGLMFVIAGILVLVMTSGSFSADTNTTSNTMGNQELSAQQKDMMAKMEAYSALNENHSLLASLAGHWNTTVEHKMSADAPFEKSQGTSHNQMIFGGRFLEQHYQGDMQGKPFEGKGVMGYDNIQKKFQNVWYDSIGTGIMTSTSTYDPAKKTFAEEGQFSCPMTNSQIHYRGVTTITDADHYTYEMFMKDDSGKEFSAMRINYERSK